MAEPSVRDRPWTTTETNRFRIVHGGCQRKTYERLKARALNMEMDLPPKLRGKTVDYRNLVYYAP